MLLQATIALALVNIYTVAWRKLINSRLVLLALSLLLIPVLCRAVQKPSLFMRYRMPRVLEQNELKKVIGRAVKDLHPDKGGSKQQFSQLKLQSQQLEADRLNYDKFGLKEDLNLSYQYFQDIQNKKMLTFYAFVFLLILTADSNLSFFNLVLKSLINSSFFIYQSVQVQSDVIQTLPLDYVLTCWTIRQRRMVLHLLLIVIQIIALPSQEQALKIPNLEKQVLSFDEYKSTDLKVETRTSSNWYEKWVRVVIVLGVIYLVLNSEIKQGNGKSSFGEQTFRGFNQEMSQQQLQDYLDNAQ